MKKKQKIKEKPMKKKSESIGESIVFALFLVSASFASLFMLKMIVLTDFVQEAVGYALGAYAILIFTYIAYRGSRKG